MIRHVEYHTINQHCLHTSPFNTSFIPPETTQTLKPPHSIHDTYIHGLPPQQPSLCLHRPSSQQSRPPIQKKQKKHKKSKRPEPDSISDFIQTTNHQATNRRLHSRPDPIHDLQIENHLRAPSNSRNS